MFINTIKLINFRNYKDLSIRFSKDINIIIGKNGQGKSNLLEAIYFLSIIKSQRAIEKKELILWGSQAAYIRAEIKEYNIDHRVAVAIKEGIPLVFEENRIRKKIKDRYIIPIILFTPDDIQMVKGSPKRRRDYLDNIISRIKPNYQQMLANYLRTITQRNAYLKNNKYKRMEEDLMDVWNKKLVSLGAKVIKERKAILDILKPEIKEQYQKMSTKKDVIDIEYKCQAEGKIKQEIEEQLKKEIQNKKKEECERGITLVGPHRDDFKVFINNKEARAYASQGEERCIVLALKLSESVFFKKFIKTEPIILLDDVLSELDEDRKNALLKNLTEREQVIITTTSEKHIPKYMLEKASKMLIENGEAWSVSENKYSYKRDSLFATT